MPGIIRRIFAALFRKPKGCRLTTEVGRNAEGKLAVSKIILERNFEEFLEEMRPDANPPSPADA